MNEIRVWSITVCSAALGCTALRLLAPRSGSGKLFGLVTASFFLCCLVLPLTTLRELPAFELPESLPSKPNAALSEQVDRQLENSLKQTTAALVRQVLTARQLTADKIDVETEFSDTGGIYMKQVTVYLDKQSASAAAAVREVLEQQLQTTVVVKTEG